MRCAFGAAHSGKPPAYRQRASKKKYAPPAPQMLVRLWHTVNAVLVIAPEAKPQAMK